MATTLPPPQTLNERLEAGNGGGVRGVIPIKDDPRSVKDPAGGSTRTGIWVALAAIGMMFAALTSALYV